jgi:hypothetical protein
MGDDVFDMFKSDPPSSEDIAKAESRGRDQAKAGDNVATEKFFASKEEKSATERGFNEQRTADKSGSDD